MGVASSQKVAMKSIARSAQCAILWKYYHHAWFELEQLFYQTYIYTESHKRPTCGRHLKPPVTRLFDPHYFPVNNKYIKVNNKCIKATYYWPSYGYPPVTILPKKNQIGELVQRRVQDSGSGSRSSPGFDALPVGRLVVPLSKALHAALLLSTQEHMGTCKGRFISRGAKFLVSCCILDNGTVESQWSGKSSEPGCGHKIVTLLDLYRLKAHSFHDYNIDYIMTSNE